MNQFRSIIPVSLLVFLLAMGNTAIAQPNQQTTGISAPYSLFSNQLHEKIFVHTDKQVYSAGDMIWLKVYLVEAGSNQLSPISKVTYLELIDAEGSAQLQVKVGMQDGIGQASISLPYSIATGAYILRGYTQWMRNFGSEVFFEKQINILNALQAAKAPEAKPSFNSIAFLPEGGNLVAGLRSRLAFKATDANGKGIAFKATILNQNLETIVPEFSAAHPGMGSINFMPKLNEQYQAIIRYENQSKPDTLTPADFPEIMSQGMVPTIEYQDNKINLKISASQSYQNSTAYLLIHGHQKNAAARIFQLKEGKASLEIPFEQLSEGVNMLTLFNQQQEPVSERLVFRYPENTAKLSFNAPTIQAGNREKISFNISFPFQVGQDTGANLSVAVYRTDSISLFDEGNLMEYLWLSSDLKGPVEQAARYFEKPESETRADMDLLMLTQGWRRYQWKQVKNSHAAARPFLPEYEGAIVEATVTDQNNNRPVAGQTLFLSIPGKPYWVGNNTTNQQGLARWVLKDVYGSQTMILQTDSVQPGRNTRLISPFSDKPALALISQFALTQSQLDLVNQYSIASQVSNHFHGKKYPIQTLNSYDTTAFFGKPDKSYLLDAFTRFSTMEEVFREYMPGLNVRLNKGSYGLRSANDPKRTFFDEAPLTLIDGMPVFDANKIIEFDPLKIQRIDQVTRLFAQGNKTFHGILSLHTYQNDLGGFPIDPRALVLAYEGLQTNRVFYQPRYDTKEQKQDRTPDFRSTLLWMPIVTLNAKGQAEITFFSSDLKGKFVAVVQGMINQQIPVSGYHGFTIK